MPIFGSFFRAPQSSLSCATLARNQVTARGLQEQLQCSKAEARGLSGWDGAKGPESRESGRWLSPLERFESSPSGLPMKSMFLAAMISWIGSAPL